MKLTLRKSDVMDDWYLIERAEHDGRTWLDRTEPGVVTLRCSARLGNADVEGPASDMLAIARGIETRSTAGGDRCEVQFLPGGVEFTSPRNSYGDTLLVSIEEADDLARQIRAALATSRLTASGR